MALKNPYAPAATIDTAHTLPVLCPKCGEIVGYSVTINGSKWLWVGTLFLPWMPFALHSCGSAVYFGKKKQKVTNTE